jgi:hypothetical protein
VLGFAVLTEKLVIANEKLHSMLQTSELPEGVVVLKSNTKGIYYVQHGGLYQLVFNPLTKYELIPPSTVVEHYLVEDGIIYTTLDNTYHSYSFEDQTVLTYLDNHIRYFISESTTTPLPEVCLGEHCKDTDGDGYTDYEEKGMLTNRWDKNSFPSVERSGVDNDNDNIDDALDNCPNKGNTKQDNLDRDAYGDSCDSDIDGDGYSNDLEYTKGTNRYRGSEYPDDILPDIPSDGVPPQANLDTDEDGVVDTEDNCPTMYNTTQWDNDDDGIGNLCDPDIDGDGYSNTEEELAKSSKWSEESTPENINGYVPPTNCSS